MTTRQVGTLALVLVAWLGSVGCDLRGPGMLVEVADLEIVGNLDDETICFLVPYTYQIQTEGEPGPSEYEVINLPPGLRLDVPTGRIGGNPSQAGTFVASLIARAPGYNEVKPKTWIVEGCPGEPGGIPLPQPPGTGAAIGIPD